MHDGPETLYIDIISKWEPIAFSIMTYYKEGSGYRQI
jgi:hypothetical protein